MVNGAELARTLSATGISWPALLAAFAGAPRERFLGPGPWEVLGPGGYETVTDPALVYRDVAVGFAPERRLNNGPPSALARLIEALGPEEGDRVVHVGCGTGYYTAILAELVGPRGTVTALEVEPGLASQAREHLAGRENVRVLAEDGTLYDPGPAERILVNAGATHPLPLWLDRLTPGGTLVLPLTDREWLGGFLRIAREGERWPARFVLLGAAYPCAGARDPQAEALLAGRFPVMDGGAVQSLRRDAHRAEETCWLHGAGYCLSTEER
ncbi:MAG TPA: rRNA adenine N-6-methyltransferase family protein [Thermoanaerobaculia bacterium]|nr:rRNA adenine N-6-methyltransferase family protein [Thermoanaerobaculia bacterium]